MELTEQEVKLIEQVRNLDWGKIEVSIKKGQPVMISVKKDIKLVLLDN